MLNRPVREGLKIAISGKSGCGNSTVSRIVAQTLGLKLINYTFRNIAQERGMTFEEVCEEAQKDPGYDLYLDKKQVEMAREGNCVLGSRLAIWVLEEADIKVYLKASPETRAERIREREEGDFEEVLKETLERDGRDSKRYKELYSIDTDSFEFADLIIDTERYNQYQVAEQIINFHAVYKSDVN